jgi:hypothetical protein
MSELDGEDEGSAKVLSKAKVIIEDEESKKFLKLIKG